VASDKGRISQRQIDRIVTAARPRILQRGYSSGGSGGTGTIPAHTHPASAVSFEAAGDLASTDVQNALEEVAEEKLARDGHQPMTGDLDLDHYDILNIFDAEVENDLTVRRNIEMTGGVGFALINAVRRITMAGIGLIENVLKIDFTGAGVGDGVIDQPRVIHMDGAPADDEAKIDGLERIVFEGTDNASTIEQPNRIFFETTNGDIDADVGTDADAEGHVGWSAEERMFSAITEDSPYNTGEGFVGKNAIFPMGWVVQRYVVSGVDVEFGDFLVLIPGSSGGFGQVSHWTASVITVDEPSDGAHRPAGIALHGAANGEAVWVMKRGRIEGRSANGGGTDGDALWADPESPGDFTFNKPDGRYARIRVGTAIDTFGGEGLLMDVDVRYHPTLAEASWVRIETLERFDVLRYVPNAGDDQWVPTQIHGSFQTDADYTFDPTSDYLVRVDAADAPVTIFLPSPEAGIVAVIKKIDATANHVTIDASTNGGTIEGDDSFDLELEGEALTVQCDGSSWAVI